MIFDRFTSREHADKFALDVKQRFRLDTRVFATEEEAFQHDPFPYALEGPIVHVERSDAFITADSGEYERVELAVERMATAYGGNYAGT